MSTNQAANWKIWCVKRNVMERFSSPRFWDVIFRLFSSTPNQPVTDSPEFELLVIFFLFIFITCFAIDANCDSITWWQLANETVELIWRTSLNEQLYLLRKTLLCVLFIPSCSSLTWRILFFNFTSCRIYFSEWQQLLQKCFCATDYALLRWSWKTSSRDVGGRLWFWGRDINLRLSVLWLQVSCPVGKGRCETPGQSELSPTGASRQTDSGVT